jgi:hypothetical protein
MTHAGRLSGAAPAVKSFLAAPRSTTILAAPVRLFSSRAALVTVSAVALPLLVAACDALTSVAVQGADFGGATADVHCDRRLTLDGGQPSAFCQDVQSTVAASQFSDDCRLHLGATPGPGLCPRAGIIAGCLLEKKNGDDSIVHDWYYDVLGDGGDEAGPDGEAPFASPVPQSVPEVAQVCADGSRYPDGAELAFP